ncbi:uncharacterized protein LOC144477990, partial [Augochlora pura]
MAARLNVVVHNRGSSTTFRRFGYRETIVDVTMASEDVAPRIDDWKVIEDYTGSDHQYVAFRIAGKQRRSQVPPSSRGWNMKTLHQVPRGPPIWRHPWGVRGVDEPREATQFEETGGQATFPTYDGTACVCGGMPNAPDALPTGKPCGKPTGPSVGSCDIKLGSASGAAGRASAKRLIGIRGNGPAILPADEASAVVDALFPVDQARARRSVELLAEDIPPFTERELTEAARSFHNRKAPGPDGIPAEVVKLAVRLFPRPMLNMLNACLGSGVWPVRWKIQRLALINKGKGQLSGPSAYRPICMVDTAGKLLEKMIRPRLLTAYRAVGDLSDRQYGFRRGRSTVDALRMVLRAAESAEIGNRHNWRVVLVATLDVRNAFNSASWAEILAALENTFHVPDYLLRLVEDYFDDRVLLYDTIEGRRR